MRILKLVMRGAWFFAALFAVCLLLLKAEPAANGRPPAGRTGMWSEWSRP